MNKKELIRFKYYFKQKNNYRIFIKSYADDWYKIDHLGWFHVGADEARIQYSDIRAFVVTYSNGEILDYYGNFNNLPEHVHDIENHQIFDGIEIPKESAELDNSKIIVSHIINRKHPKTGYYETTIKNNTNHKIRIKRFGGYKVDGNKYELNNIVNSLYSASQFQSWFNTGPEGWILPNSKVSDPNNYGGANGYWIYFIENELGEEFIIGKRIAFE